MNWKYDLYLFERVVDSLLRKEEYFDNKDHESASESCAINV